MTNSVDPRPSSGDARGAWARGFGRLVDLRPGEGRLLALSCVYFFTLLASYFILRPVRESLGIARGAESLPWLFTGTMATMIVLTPAFAWLVARVPRQRLLPIVYRIASLCLIAFYALFRVLPEGQQVMLGYVFFVWLSVFNAFVVSLFWGFMADVWRFEQAKRLFGFIGVGGTIGAIWGSSIASFATGVGTYQLLLISIVLLELAAWLVRIIVRARELDPIDSASDRARDEELRARAPSNVWRGVALVLQQPYLRAIAAYTFCYGLIGTFLYYQQGALVASTIPDRDARTELYGIVETISQTLTLGIQLFLTGRIISRFGIGFALLTQPFLAAAGCVCVTFAYFFSTELHAAGWAPFGLVPELAVVLGVQILVKASNHATSRPAREALYTVVEREVKYKSKPFIDTAVWRFGDQVGIWSTTWLKALGMSVVPLASVAVGLACGWVGVGFWLARRQRALTGEESPRVESLPAELRSRVS